MKCKCKFIKKIYLNSQNGYTVSLYKMLDSITRNGEPVDEFTAYGYYLPIDTHANVEVSLSGGWVKNQYGFQFEVQSYDETVEPTEKGITAYLSSCVKGVGPKLAKKIFDRFGLESLHVMDQEPERLLEIPGVTITKCDNMISSYNASQKVRGLITFLAPHDISAARARSIYGKLGDRALEIVKNQPFTLCKLSGIGFKTADEIARAVGFDACSFTRVFEGVNCVLRDVQSQGHLYLPWEELVNKSLALLKNCQEADTLDRSHIDKAIDRMLQNELLRCERTEKFGNLIYPIHAYLAERGIAIAITRLMSSDKDFRFQGDPGQVIERTEKKLGIIYSGRQKQALIAVFQNPVSVITGHPGTGKTTVLRGILDLMYRFRPEARVMLCSPTGRAARRMAETTGHDASTIHSALELPDNNNYMNYEKKCLAAFDLIVVDEVSMLDAFLANVLLSSIQTGTKVVLVGDPDQLPSVGPGAVLAELIRCRVVPVTVLDEIFRQAQNSRIVRNSANIRLGIKKLDFGEDFQYIKADDDKDAVEKIEIEYLKALASGIGLDDIEILTPRKDTVATSSDMLNQLLRDKINPPGSDKKEINVNGRIFRQGDKVIQLKNKSRMNLNNGDIGYIEAIFGGDDPRAIINFGDGRKVEYRPVDFRFVKWAYAMTVHKSQGNEHKAIILCLMKSHYGGGLLKRNLAYTGITRAKSKLVLIGQIQALYMAIDNPDTERRNTLLADRIRSYLSRLKTKGRKVSDERLQAS